MLRRNILPKCSLGRFSVSKTVSSGTQSTDCLLECAHEVKVIPQILTYTQFPAIISHITKLPTTIHNINIIAHHASCLRLV